MKRLLTLVAAVFLVVQVTPAGAQGARPVELGTDPSGDAPPALDLTYLQVAAPAAHHGPPKDLEIRIGVAGMLPVIGGYPELPGIEWIFDVKGRTFVAEAAIVRREPAFFLFEKKGDSFEQIGTPEGTYDPADGFIRILVPLKDIGARSGTRISGTGPKGTEDVDSHIHAIVADHVPDTMATTRDFVIP